MNLYLKSIMCGVMRSVKLVIRNSFGKLLVSREIVGKRVSRAAGTQQIFKLKILQGRHSDLHFEIMTKSCQWFFSVAPKITKETLLRVNNVVF